MVSDHTKLLTALLAYGLVAPLLGAAVAPSRLLQKLLFAFLIFAISMDPGITTWMLDSIEWYRGHTKGFELSLIEILALASIIGSRLSPSTLQFKFFSPGVIFYLFYCGLATFSVVSSFEESYVYMATFKFTKVILVFIAASNFLQKRSDIKWGLDAIAVTLLVQCLVAFKCRFIDGQYRVQGWFEHQNSLAYWAYMMAIPLLAVALHRKTAWPRTILYFSGVVGAGLIVILTVTRASIAAFGLSAAVVIGIIILINGVTWKRAGVVAGGAFAAMIVLLFAGDTLMERFMVTKDYNPDTSFRLLLDQMSVSMVDDFPLGVGWNNYGIANSQPVADYSWHLEQAAIDLRGVQKINLEDFTDNPLTENLYFLAWAETGYQGLIAYVFFMVLTLFWCFRNARSHFDHPFGYFLLGLGIVLAVAYMHGLIERILTQTKNLTIWLLLAGLAARAEYWRRIGGKSSRSANPWLGELLTPILQGLIGPPRRPRSNP